MTPSVDLATFVARHADGARVIDVREPAEYIGGHVPGAMLAPMSRIWMFFNELPRDEDVYVICQSGNRSRSMTDVLAANGIRAISVEGGTSSWVAAGQPVVTGPRAA